jgi:hypothetical protein
MQQAENGRRINTLVQRALASGGIAAQPGRSGNAHARPGQAPSERHPQSGPSEILQRLAQVIQLMRFDHADAHVYREGCDILAREAVDASAWTGLRPALEQILRLVAQGDYHCALMELRAISQPEWHTC